MGKFLKTLVTGVAAGAAVGYFLSTKKGQEFKDKASDLAKDYKENPEVYHKLAKEKAETYKDLAVTTFTDYKEKFETGELTTDDVLDSVKDGLAQAGDFANDQVTAFRDKVLKAKEDSPLEETQAQVDDIIIDYPQNPEDLG